MIDAGSTGSRIHIYKFHNCGPSPEFEYEVFEMIKGGLSSYRGDPAGAAKSLDRLMDRAMEVVPEKFRKCTPVAVKATAGLRLLGAEESKNILDAVKTRLDRVYPFPVVKKDGVVIMDGKDEGQSQNLPEYIQLLTIGLARCLCLDNSKLPPKYRPP